MHCTNGDDPGCWCRAPSRYFGFAQNVRVIHLKKGGAKNFELLQDWCEGGIVIGIQHGLDVIVVGDIPRLV